jgi:hypothetical protein
MTPQELLEFLHEVLDGRATPESLFGLLDAPGAVTPETASGLLRELEERYVRGEVHFGLYLPLKDRLQQVMRPRTTRPPTSVGGATGPPVAPPSADRTQLRTPTGPRADRTLFRASPAETLAAGTRASRGGRDRRDQPVSDVAVQSPWRLVGRTARDAYLGHGDAVGARHRDQGTLRA